MPKLLGRGLPLLWVRLVWTLSSQNKASPAKQRSKLRSTKPRRTNACSAGCSAGSTTLGVGPDSSGRSPPESKPKQAKAAEQLGTAKHRRTGSQQVPKLLGNLPPLWVQTRLLSSQKQSQSPAKAAEQARSTKASAYGGAL